MIRGLRPQYPRSQAGVFITMGRGQSVSKYCQIILLDLDKQYQNNYIIILFLTPPGNGYKAVFDAAVVVYRDLKPCNVKLLAAAVSLCLSSPNILKCSNTET